MQRRRLLALLGSAVPGLAAWPARADAFMAIATRTLRGDAGRLGWTSLQAGCRVYFPDPGSGRRFMDRRLHVIEALERQLAQTRYDPDAGASRREHLERLIADTVERAAPRGTVLRIGDIWISAR